MERPFSGSPLVESIVRSRIRLARIKRQLIFYLSVRRKGKNEWERKEEGKDRENESSREEGESETEKEAGEKERRERVSFEEPEVPLFFFFFFPSSIDMLLNAFDGGDDNGGDS